MVKEDIELMAKNLRKCADHLDYVADRVDGANRDDMIIDPIEALALTRAFASRVVDFCASANQFEIQLFGVPPPSPPASQMPEDGQVPSECEPPPLKLSLAEEEKRPREDPIDSPEEGEVVDDGEPDKKRKRFV